MNQNPLKIFQARKIDIDFTMDQKSGLLLIERFLISDDNFFLLSGYAGTGKTTIAENIARFAKASMLAPTNTAVKRLKEKILSDDIGADRFSTIHGALYGAPDPETGEFKKGSGLNHSKVYVVDEISMVDTKVLGDLMEQAIKNKVKLIFIGDNFQLEPIGKDPQIFRWEQTNDKFRDIWKAPLKEVVRNEGNILAVATELRTSQVAQIKDMNEDDFKLVNIFTQDLKDDIENDENYVILTSTNKARMNFNRQVRNVRFEDDAKNVVNDWERVIAVANLRFLNGEQYTMRHPKLIDTIEATVNIGSKVYPEHRTFKFYYIEHEVDGRHGQFKTLLVPGLDKPSLYQHSLMQNLKFKMDHRFTKRQRSWRIWNPNVNIATYGYATSVHKSQGNEWDNVYIDASWLSDKWNKARWLYTAITRAKKKVELKRSNHFKIVP